MTKVEHLTDKQRAKLRKRIREKNSNISRMIKWNKDMAKSVLPKVEKPKAPLCKECGKEYIEFRDSQLVKNAIEKDSDFSLPGLCFDCFKCKITEIRKRKIELYIIIGALICFLALIVVCWLW